MNVEQLNNTRFPVAEIFTSVQGEGVYTGTPMTFIRLVGCSVGKKVCHFCDTDFDRTYEWRGGGSFTIPEIRTRIHTQHVCITGGEPFDQELLWLLIAGLEGKYVHIETSGTKDTTWLVKNSSLSNPGNVRTATFGDGTESFHSWIWISCCPKPGYDSKNIYNADEIKVIVPGLGTGPGWPTLEDALYWSTTRPVFLQPRNKKHEIDQENYQLCMELVLRNPSLRLSSQMHKFIHVR